MSSPESNISNAGERFVPGERGVVALEHLHRYMLACDLVAGKHVLDIASGEGYGSAMLARQAKQVTGVDISDRAVDHANQRYGSGNLSYLQGRCSAIPLKDSSVDVVVSFETIEHHDEHVEMMDEVARVLKQNGILIISSPDRHFYSDVPQRSNPYHVKELYFEEFEALLKSRFTNVAISSQRAICGSAIAPRSSIARGGAYFRTEDSGAVASFSSIPEPLYHIAWASNGVLPAMTSGFLEQTSLDVGVASWCEKEVAIRDKQIADAHHVVNSQSEKIVDTQKILDEKSKELSELSLVLSELRIKEANLQNRINEVGERAVRVIRTMRKVKRNLLLEQGSRSRITLAQSVHNLWDTLPLSVQVRQRAKRWLFSNFPRLLGGTHSYRAWLSFETMERGGAGLPASDGSQSADQRYVPKYEGGQTFELSARVICFYLPQFHAIPENDEWWGGGFTEWTNVKPAKPLFEGHYQPHHPDELGYYDLSNTSVQRQQIDLAKLYGVGGFCFYFYWFGGKTLLEKPIENYLRDSSLDFPFCLCWANENWSRRWDGLDSEILIAQKHSPEDDIAFIEHIAKYMLDDRYIRINGKPLLLVYRPNLLPDARETGERWRNWCLQNGIGEIYLAYTQSFEAVEPGVYGFDAAVEFPPNTPKGHQVPPNISSQFQESSEGFEATVYDWRALVAKSRDYSRPEYPLFRSVNPSWDNTPRRKSKGTVFLHSSPVGYQEWLVNAISDTQSRFQNQSERLVFVNAWNEWAEGAYLEPDRKYGYAFLEATRMAHVRTSLVSSEPPGRSLAVVIHAFYVDIFEEIVERLLQVKVAREEIKLFVTTPYSQASCVEEVLTASGFSHMLLPVENRGRDILPFLRIMNNVVKEGYVHILKLHTKKSTHRPDGVEWRNDLFDKLISTSAVDSAINIFESRPDVGVIGPAGHVVSMATFWGSNQNLVTSLSHRLGQPIEKIRPLSFVAGSMFFARTDGLSPLLNLSLPDDAFDVEAGQVDGTLAHALERAISISAGSMGLRTVSSDCLEVGLGAKSYRFAEQAR